MGRTHISYDQLLQENRVIIELINTVEKYCLGYWFLNEQNFTVIMISQNKLGLLFYCFVTFTPAFMRGEKAAESKIN